MVVSSHRCQEHKTELKHNSRCLFIIGAWCVKEQWTSDTKVVQVRIFYTCKALAKRSAQVDASWKLGSSCDSVWPGIAWLALRWLAMPCAHFDRDPEFARKSKQVFHRLDTQPKSSQVEWRPLTYYKPMKYRICLLWNGLFLPRLACTCEETCECVWPPNASHYASSTCVHLRLLASPFDQGLSVLVIVITK